MADAGRLITSITRNNFRQVTLLLEAGCDVNVVNSSGATPLISCLVHISDADAQMRVLKQLLAAGADVNKTDKQRKCPLTYACALNQDGAVKLLLEQNAINANLPDYDGVTPLMHAAALGRLEIIQTMMEYNRSGMVSVDVTARDNNGLSATDHAKFSNSRDTSEKVQELLMGYSNDVGAIRCPSPASQGQGEDIELKDMKKPDGGDSDHHSPGSKSPLRNVDNRKVLKAGRNEEIKEADKMFAGDHGTSIQHWTEDVIQQHTDAVRLSSLISPPGGSHSRPGSRLDKSKNIPLVERPSSSLSVPEPSYRRPNSSNRHASRKKVGGYAGSDEDDEDFSLESLSELLGTVRQYAKEIHEIYAPIQKDKEERIRKKHERRKSKDHGRNAVASQLTSSGQHEVRVEIHALEDQLRRNAAGRHKGRNRPESFSHSKSQEPSPTHPMALLHVENEQLSRTWPRGRPRPHSQERFLSDTNLEKANENVMRAASSSTFSRPSLPADWNDGSAVHERDILTKAFHRIQMPSKDPLLDYKKKASNPQLQKQLNSSRQSVIDVAKHHQQSRQAALPSISIIPPPSEHRQVWDVSGGVLPSAPQLCHDSFSQVTPTAPYFSEHESRDFIIPISEEKIPRQSKNGGAGVKSSSKTGLRRRKSVEQGLGQGSATLEKY